MCKLRRFLILCMAVLMTSNIMTSVSFASSIPDDGKVETRAVYDTIDIPASKCKEIYLEMEGQSAWDDLVVTGVLSILGPLGSVAGGIYSIASIIQGLNYKMARRAFKAGWENGNGCRIVIYDNALPWVYAL